MDDSPSDDGHERGDVLDGLVLDGEVVGGENGEVREQPWDEPSLLAILRGEPRAPLGPEPKRGRAVEPVRLVVELSASYGAAGDKPVERDPRVVAGDARRIGSGPHGHAGIEHSAARRRARGRGGPVTLYEILALIAHALVARDSASDRPSALAGARVDRL